MKERGRERATVIGLTILLGLGLAVAGVAAGAALLWLFGPWLTVLLAVVSVIIYVVVRAAVRAARTDPGSR